LPAGPRRFDREGKASTPASSRRGPFNRLRGARP
jgi:hypothetical protein